MKQQNNDPRTYELLLFIRNSLQTVKPTLRLRFEQFAIHNNPHILNYRYHVCMFITKYFSFLQLETEQQTDGQDGKVAVDIIAAGKLLKIVIQKNISNISG